MDMDTSELTREIVATIADICHIEAEAIDPDADYEAVGLDSLERLAVLSEVEARLDIRIPDADLGEMTTVHRTVERLSALVAESAEQAA
jgi:acyl carrier protein